MSEEKFNVPLNPAFHHHNSHGMGEHMTGHSTPGNIARDGAPKRLHSIAINGGMVKTTKSGYRAFGGDHATALDSLSGAVVPVNSGTNVAAHGGGNAGLHKRGEVGGALPTKQHMKPVQVHPSMAHRATPGMTDLGKAIIRQALSVASGDDKVAFSQRLPLATDEE